MQSTPSIVLMIVAAVLSFFLAETICDEQTYYSNTNSNTNNNAWPSLGNDQYTQRPNGFTTVTPWPSLGSNSRHQYNLVDSILPENSWVQSRYNSNRQGIDSGGLGGGASSNGRNTYTYGSSQSSGRSRQSQSNSYNQYGNTYGRSSGSAVSGSSYTNNRDRQNQGRNTGASDEELREFSEELLRKDRNNAARYITINFQRKTTSRSQRDEAPLPLVKIDNSAVYDIPTIKKIRKLHDNYELYSNVREQQTTEERNEEDDLLNAVISTDVMEHTRNFLIEKGKISRDPAEFKNLLKDIWFEMYARGGGRVGSSGFEHIFVTEVKNNQISGLHNWLFFGEEEKNDRANYLGYMKKLDLGDKGAIVRLHFTYNGIDKPVGSMFVGTSPELEMAVYTTCFALRADHVCPLKMNGNRFIIRTYTYRFHGKNLIGSAFPEI